MRNAVVGGGVAMTVLACDGIYDDPDTVAPVQTKENSYQYIDATKYTNWIYINLHGRDSVTLDYRYTANIPHHWDLAIHRYDVKTNGGGALETNYTSLDALRSDIESGVFVEPVGANYKEDVADSIIVDMTTMMQGYITRSASAKNLEMGKWLDVDLSTMPPIYTPSGKVYLLRMSDATVAAIRFTGFSNPNLYNTKGYISFDYLYPLNFTR